MHNIPCLCPALAQVFSNTYSQPACLFISGGGEILSQEGTCQGDPLAMAIYAVAITPLIKQLAQSCPPVTQCWCAVDDGTRDDLAGLRHYWDKLCQLGSGYGYFPNSVKTILVTKPEHRSEVDRLFTTTGVTIRSDGSRYLGGALGETEFCHSFMVSLVEKWSKALSVLAELAQTQPHAAYTVFMKGLSSSWRYRIRSTECSPEIFATLDHIINTTLLPAFTGCDFDSSQPERILLSLPARLGGLAVPIVQDIAKDEHTSSITVTQPLGDVINGQKPDDQPQIDLGQVWTDPVLTAIAGSRS